MEGSLKCAVCGSTEKLQRCGFCKSAFYCSRDHQVKDWKMHKEMCQKIKNARRDNVATNRTAALDNGSAATRKDEPDHTGKKQVGDEQAWDYGSVVETCVDGVNIGSNSKGDNRINIAQNDSSKSSDELKRHKTTDASDVDTDAAADGDKGFEFDDRAFKPCKTLTMSPKTSIENLGKVVVDKLIKHGFCIIDDYFTSKDIDNALIDIHECEKTGMFVSGRLAGGKTGDDVNKQVVNSGIRSDKIMWLEGNEGHVPGISRIMSGMDKILTTFNVYLDGRYFINRRTKAMIACYPGSGAYYKRHVDNPKEDGRVVTCILYLNKNWNVEEHGGFLRILPADTDTYYDVAPQANRLLFFWSDRRNPHEVHPAFRTRYAITVWYMDKSERERAKSETESHHAVYSENKDYSIGHHSSTQISESEVTKQIDDVASSAISSLSHEELQAISAIIKDQPNPRDILLQLGIIPEIMDKLIVKLQNL